MGITSFLVPEPDRLTSSAVRECYMQGIDAIPWQSKNVLEGDLLRIQRAASESGQLFVPWPVRGRGRLTLCTTCLCESVAPYHLPLELARGTVARLRNQYEIWSLAGMEPSADVKSKITAATAALGRAATTQSRPQQAAVDAELAIREAVSGIETLMEFYSQTALAKLGKRTIFFGVNLGTHAGSKFPDELLGVANTVVVPFSWPEVEGSAGHDSLQVFAEQVRWGRRLGSRVCGGPLLNFDRNCLPDWLYLWEDDPESLQSYMLRYVDTIVRKFAGQVNLWHAWAGLNCGQAMSLREELRLRIGVAALEILRKADPSTPAFVSFDQPWGEYMARQPCDLAPIHYADTLVRADLGVSGFGLELNLGYRPHGTLPRDLLELSRLLDRWSTLGLPLVVILAIPSLRPPADGTNGEIMPTGADELNMTNQAQLAHDLIRTCLSKAAVQGVIWNQLVDGDSANYPAAGLFAQDGVPKPILSTLREIRKAYMA